MENTTFQQRETAAGRFLYCCTPCNTTLGQSHHSVFGTTANIFPHQPGYRPIPGQNAAGHTIDIEQYRSLPINTKHSTISIILTGCLV